MSSRSKSMSTTLRAQPTTISSMHRSFHRPDLDDVESYIPISNSCILYFTGLPYRQCTYLVPEETPTTGRGGAAYVYCTTNDIPGTWYGPPSKQFLSVCHPLSTRQLLRYYYDILHVDRTAAIDLQICAPLREPCLLYNSSVTRTEHILHVIKAFDECG
jgi:hypothetical protein